MTRRITVDEIMALRPCSQYPRARVEALSEGRGHFTPLQIARLTIPWNDRAWVLARTDLDVTRHWALDCATAALMFSPRADDRSVHAVVTAHAYLDGSASERDVHTAAAAADAADAAAADAAAVDAAYAAAAAVDAVYAAAAAVDVAYAAAAAAVDAAYAADAADAAADVVRAAALESLARRLS